MIETLVPHKILGIVVDDDAGEDDDDDEKKCLKEVFRVVVVGVLLVRVVRMSE